MTDATSSGTGTADVELEPYYLDDAFAALLMLRPAWFARLVWLSAQAMCLIAALALMVTIVMLAAAVGELAYRAGFHSLFASEEEIQAVKDTQSTVARSFGDAFVAGLIGLALAGTVMGVLKTAGRSRAIRGKVVPRRPTPPPKRLTRGRRAMQERRMKVGLMAVSAAGAIVCGAVFGYTPWASGLSVGGRIGNSLLFVLTAGALYVLPFVLLGLLIGIVGVTGNVQGELSRFFARWSGAASTSP